MSPSRRRAIGPLSTASGVTWIAAGTLPEAPDMRPVGQQSHAAASVLQHTQRRRQLVQFRHAIGARPLEAKQPLRKSPSRVPALKAS